MKVETQELTFEDEQMMPPPIFLMDLPPREYVGEMSRGEVIQALLDGCGLSLGEETGCYSIELRQGKPTFEVWDYSESDSPSYSRSYVDLDSLLEIEASRPGFVLGSFELIG